MRHGTWFPLTGELAEPRAAVEVAVAAEEHGWDGFFVWDHVSLRDHALADPWVVMAAAAAATERVAIGPMVTPLARRRPGKLARETTSLDRLSGGRLVLGVGLGSDVFGREYSAFGEAEDDRTRAGMLDESLAILEGAWSGEPVDHHGSHHTIDGVTFLPRPVRGRVPVWVAGYPGRPKPMQRAARHDGFFPVNVESTDQLAEVGAQVRGLVGDRPFELVAERLPEADPAPYAAAGATWALTDVPPESLTLDRLLGVVREGPPES